MKKIKNTIVFYQVGAFFEMYRAEKEKLVGVERICDPDEEELEIDGVVVTGESSGTTSNLDDASDADISLDDDAQSEEDGEGDAE